MATPSAQESSDWDEDPAWSRPDPMTAAELEAGLDRVCDQDEPPGEEESGDFEPFTADELAEIRQAAADELLAVEAAATGRRGPGQPGSARVFPGESASPAASFGPGMALDVLPGCAALAVAADAAAGGDGGFAGVPEAELAGVLCAWDRVEAHAAARKLAVSAELARRNPAPPDAGFTAGQVAYALGESRGRAGDLIDLAQTLQARLPGTAAALDDGTITRYKAEIIARATALLGDAGARAAEDKVLDRAARLTPCGLRAAIAAAVMETAPEKAKERREAAAKDARVERWAEDSGNAALMGCELPRTRSSPPTSGSPPGLRNRARPGWKAAWTSSAPALSWTCCWARTPVRAGTRAAAQTAPAPARAGQARRARTRHHPRPDRRPARPGSPGGSP